jgi:hypothetical protein
MNLLLLAVPLGWLAYFLHWNAIAVFVLVSIRSKKKLDAYHAISAQLRCFTHPCNLHFP